MCVPFPCHLLQFGGQTSVLPAPLLWDWLRYGLNWVLIPWKKWKSDILWAAGSLCHSIRQLRPGRGSEVPGSPRWPEFLGLFPEHFAQDGKHLSGTETWLLQMWQLMNLFPFCGWGWVKVCW